MPKMNLDELACRRTPMRRIALPGWPTVFIAICLCAGFAERSDAGFSIEIRVDGGPPTIYPDNGPDDKLDLVDFAIEIDFNVTDVGKNWAASGTVLATGGGGYPPVSTIVTDTLIENTSGAFLQGKIDIVHNYAASGLHEHTAELDGQFENVLGNNIGYAAFEYHAAVNGMSLGTIVEGPVQNATSPQAFVGGNLGPLLLPTTTKHEIGLRFYLGDPGDAIRLFNSAEIHMVPEPSSASLTAISAALVLGWSGRSRLRNVGARRR